MMTTEQQQQIINYLMEKSLPVDLTLEVKDHISHQIENVMAEKEMLFDDAFEQAKESWNDELKLVWGFPFFTFKKITRLHKRVMNKVHYELLFNSLKYFIPFFVINLLLTLYFPAISKALLLLVYVIILASTIFLYVKNYSLIKSSTYSEKRKISIYQRGAVLLHLSAVYVFILGILKFEERFESQRNSFLEIVSELNFNNIDSIITAYIFVLGWILGFLYFRKYKNALEQIQQQITFNL